MNRAHRRVIRAPKGVLFNTSRDIMKNVVMIMKENTYISHSTEETIQFAKEFSQKLDKGCVMMLLGDLGAGKTAFTKGIALGLGIEDTISSPTFTLLKEYEGRLKLNHIDAYRLENADPSALGLYDLIQEDALVVIEWGNYIEDLDADYSISIDYVDENTRKITVREA